MATEQRLDIQALRAVAVSLVLLNHLWPNRLTGGYVGVDVFFVISGFLITSSLVSRPPQKFMDVVVFWARRMRRLLPAACLVLILTMLAALFFGPATLVPSTAKQAVASAFYVQNWVLAGNATDYFAANATHTAMQHYWSLSVEEQFYFVWPILILVMVWAAQRFGWRRALIIGLAIVAALSFASSVWYTIRQPSAAYFVTFTRMWELAVGGVLAVLVLNGLTLRSKFLRAVLAWGGLIAIAASAVMLSANSQFPGYVAAVPVAGSLMVILSASDHVTGSPWTFWRFRPIQVLGDISYSVYLWHWPVVMLVPAALHRTMGWPSKLVLIAIVFGISWLTKRFVEDTFRYSQPLVKSWQRTFVMGISLMLVVGLVSGGAVLWGRHRDAVERERIAQIIAQYPKQCIGAGGQLSNDCPPLDKNVLFVSPTDAKVNPWLNCNTFPPYDPHSCTLGADPSSATKRILLIGNSHATQWAPLLDTLGKQHGWLGETLTASGCVPYVGMTIDYGPDTDACKRLGDQMLAKATSGDYDLVIYSAWPSDPIIGRPDHWEAVAESQQQVFDMLTSKGIKLLVIRDTPHGVMSIPDCVSGNPDNMQACDYPDITATQSVDAMYDIASKSGLGNVFTVDVNDLLCQNGTCHAVVGGLITYHDNNHLSVAFANSLAPRVEPVLVEALG